MKTVEYFKASRQTPRFNKNQKVWIRLNAANYLEIRFKFRGKGRYVNGYIDKWSNNGQSINPVIGEIKAIEVDDDFAARIYGEI